MTFEGMLGLAAATFVFAVLPGPGIAAVVAQAIGRGFRPAVVWCAGQVAGDMVYLLFAMLGLGFVAKEFGSAFVVLKWAGAAYLIWLGITCIRDAGKHAAKMTERAAGAGAADGPDSAPDAGAELMPAAGEAGGDGVGVLRAGLSAAKTAPYNRKALLQDVRGFLGGGLVSLGNPKAIAFYCGFLPGFVDMKHLTNSDMAEVVAITVPIVFLVPVAYAALAARTGRAVRGARFWKWARRGAGGVMIGTGVTVATR